MSYRVEVQRQGSEWTSPLLRFETFERADQAAWSIWSRRRGLIVGVRIIDVARETQPDLDPVVLLMEQRRTAS